jgi:hypothetical protein
VLQYRWYANKDKKANGSWYAQTNTRKSKMGLHRKAKLHRFILLAPEGIKIDHIDGNGLNNRRSNLRLATQSRLIRNAGKRTLSARNKELCAEYKAIQDACIKSWREAAKTRRRERYEAQRETRRLKDCARSVAFCKWRLENDPAYKVKHYLRKAIRRKMQAVGAKKSNRTFPLVGCSIGHLMAYIEARFRPGMAWNNYGKVWHFDHVRPCSSFNLLKPSEQKKCFHYSNLQPLFARENLSKNRRYLKQQKFFAND